MEYKEKGNKKVRQELIQTKGIIKKMVDERQKRKNEKNIMKKKNQNKM